MPLALPGGKASGSGKTAEQLLSKLCPQIKGLPVILNHSAEA